MNPDFLLLSFVSLVFRWLLTSVQWMLVPFCFVMAWLLVAMVCWNLWSALHQGLAQARRMHQIPCAGCQFFTGNYHLKCAVHPDIALSEAAIDCSDYATPDYTTTVATICDISSTRRY